MIQASPTYELELGRTHFHEEGSEPINMIVQTALAEGLKRWLISSARQEMPRLHNLRGLKTEGLLFPLGQSFVIDSLGSLPSRPAWGSQRRLLLGLTDV